MAALQQFLSSSDPAAVQIAAFAAFAFSATIATSGAVIGAVWWWAWR